MSKMIASGRKIIDVGELMAELEAELNSKDSFNRADPYDCGMRDAYVWMLTKLKTAQEVDYVSPGAAVYTRMKESGG